MLSIVVCCWVRVFELPLKEFWRLFRSLFKILILSSRDLIAWLSLWTLSAAPFALSWLFLWTLIAILSSYSSTILSPYAAFTFALSWSTISNKFAIALFELSCLSKTAVDLISSSVILLRLIALFGAWEVLIKFGIFELE